MVGGLRRVSAESKNPFSHMNASKMVADLSFQTNVLLEIKKRENILASKVDCCFVLAAPGHVRDLSSPTRDEPAPPAVGVWSPNHWTAREVPN